MLDLSISFVLLLYGVVKNPGQNGGFGKSKIGAIPEIMNIMVWSFFEKVEGNWHQLPLRAIRWKVGCPVGVLSSTHHLSNHEALGMSSRLLLDIVG